MTCRTMILLMTLAFGMVAMPLAAEAQPSTKVPRVGILSPQKSTEPPTVQREPFERGLRELGWTPGGTILIEYRYAEGEVDRLPELAADLVRLPVDVLVTRGPQATQAARQATRTIPIVMSATPDPVQLGFVSSLARPTGNITGLAFLARGSLAGKRLELLKQTVAGLARVAYLVNWHATLPDQAGTIMEEITHAAQALGLESQPFEVRRAQDMAEAFIAMEKAQIGGLLVDPDPHVLEPNLAQVVALALQHRLPAIYPWRLYVDAGGLMSYATGISHFHRRSATYVDKILKGMTPAELPVEQPTTFELVINLKTAQALGLTIPPILLFQADEVIR
ncbi:MAG TPA: ABC transporter substrate-binding protein [Candidatus Tectomicrobia bacterium]|nr:ABC transporter substrate-binding protein [Candidatus Tectomicrobia bacterium]